MKTLPFAVNRLLQNSNFWLCAIAIGLTALHLSFTLKLTEPLNQDSAESTYPVLERAWFSWYEWWSPRFPKHELGNNPY